MRFSVCARKYYSETVSKCKCKQCGDFYPNVHQRHKRSETGCRRCARAKRIASGAQGRSGLPPKRGNETGCRRHGGVKQAPTNTRERNELPPTREKLIEVPASPNSQQIFLTFLLNRGDDFSPLSQPSNIQKQGKQEKAPHVRTRAMRLKTAATNRGRTWRVKLHAGYPRPSSSTTT